MSWEFTFALMKHFYGFSHEEICNLTICQFNMYMGNMADVHNFLQGEKKKDQREKVQRSELIEMIVQMGHRIPATL